MVVLDELVGHIADSGLVYRHHDDVVIRDRVNTRLRPLATDGRAEPKASANLANVVTCVQTKSDRKTGEIESWEFSLPDKVCDQLFAYDDCLRRLPAIRGYAKHPVFDGDFRLLGPGFHSDVGILVQGAPIHPDMSALPEVPRAPRRLTREVADALAQLPPRLRTLLRDFDWRGHVDLVNALGATLMGFLMNHFVEGGHPMVVIRGNQPAIGKSLLAKVIATVFDAANVAAIKKASDEEFDKLLCAMLKKRRRVVFLDNQRGHMDSERIEQLVTSPVIMLRLLGLNEFGEWPNDVLFLTTSNDFLAGRDLVTRNLAIDLYTEGDPRVRQQERQRRKPLAYAKEHRQEILSELAAMVLRWLESGRPDGDLNTRFEEVSRVVGGILDANGLPGFASNAEVAAAEMDQDYMRACDLAESLAAGQHPHLTWTGEGDPPRDAGGDAKQWVSPLESAKIIERDDDAPTKSRTQAAGRALSALVDRPLTVEGEGSGLVVTITKRRLAGNKHKYVAVVAVATDPTIEESAPETLTGCGDPPPTSSLATPETTPETTGSGRGDGAEQAGRTAATDGLSASAPPSDALGGTSPSSPGRAVLDEGQRGGGWYRQFRSRKGPPEGSPR
jgi:hypothetical protein